MRVLLKNFPFRPQSKDRGPKGNGFKTWNSSVLPVFVFFQGALKPSVY